MRLFGSDRVMKVVNALGMEEDDNIEHNMLSKAIENAQKKVEGNNFGIRKHLLEYDQVMNEQREIIYSERMKVLSGQDLRENILTMIKGVIDRAVDLYAGEHEHAEDWDLLGLNENLMPLFHKPVLVLTKEEMDAVSKENVKTDLYEKAVRAYEAKEEEFSPDEMRVLERVILLRVIDQKWMDHIDDMDQMRQGITLRAYAQRDPLVEYKFISFDMFEEVSNNIQTDTVRTLYNTRKASAPKKHEPVVKEMFTNMDESLSKEPVKRKSLKVGRNDPCPCGSGRKYKLCHGKTPESQKQLAKELQVTRKSS